MKELLTGSAKEQIGGAVVYFGDMQYYGSGGTAINEINAAGFRLFTVDPKTRGNLLGKPLTHSCIELARDQNQSQVIIHSIKVMDVAWKIYENMSFIRSVDFDFLQGELPVYGFRLKL